MKYGVNTMVWTTRIDGRLAPLFVKIKQWGFDGVELFLSLDEPANIAAVNKMLDAAGLERTTCSVLPREANLVSADAQVRARGVEFLKKCLDRTADRRATDLRPAPRRAWRNDRTAANPARVGLVR
jgi:D-psicose/D-tagatose/L-ribulose 3-epimerase